MKHTVVASAAVLTVLLLAACGAAEPTATPELPTPPPASAFPLVVTDGVGNRLTIAAKPERIVSLAPSHTEILYALGLGEQVVGVTRYCNYPPEAASKPQVGGFSDIDLEQVVGLDPDLVLASTLHQAEVVPALQERKIAVFVDEPQTVVGAMESILKIGHITGRDQEADALVAQMQERIRAIQDAIADSPKPRVFWELGPELYTAGPGSFIDDLLATAGAENVAADADTTWPQLSMEAIVLKNPEVVVLADHNYGETAETLTQRPGWQGIQAVVDGRIVEITDDDIVSRPGPRIVDGLEFLAKALHPERFP